MDENEVSNGFLMNGREQNENETEEFKKIFSSHNFLSLKAFFDYFFTVNCVK